MLPRARRFLRGCLGEGARPCQQRGRELRRAIARLQQRAADQLKREQHWKQTTKHQISQYEGHVALDLREKQFDVKNARLEAATLSLTLREKESNDLFARRQEQFAQQAASLDRKQEELGQLEDELNAFRRVVLPEQLIVHFPGRSTFVHATQKSSRGSICVT